MDSDSYSDSSSEHDVPYDNTALMIDWDDDWTVKPISNVDKSRYPGSILNNVTSLSKKVPDQDYSLSEILGLVKPRHTTRVHLVPPESYTYEYEAIELPGLSEDTRELHRPDEQSKNGKNDIRSTNRELQRHDEQSEDGENEIRSTPGELHRPDEQSKKWTNDIRSTPVEFHRPDEQSKKWTSDDIRSTHRKLHRHDDQSKERKDSNGSTTSSESEGYKSGEDLHEGEDSIEKRERNENYQSELMSSPMGTPVLVIRRQELKSKQEEDKTHGDRFMSMYDNVKSRRRSCVLQGNIQYDDAVYETSPRGKTPKRRTKKTRSFQNKISHTQNAKTMIHCPNDVVEPKHQH